jgi:GxxExxY protein
MAELLYPELSYQIVGVLYTVYNNLGYGYQEKYYQRAVAKEFDRASLQFQKEQKIIIKYRGDIIGRYFIDFVVEKSVVVELKVGNEFLYKDIKQVLAYLKAGKLRLGMLCIFTKQGIKVRRLAN